MYKRFIKRFLDIVLSIIAIIILSPVYLILSVLVFVFMGWPVLFRQPRPGKDEKIFNMYKFRTMSNSKDKDGNMLPDELRLTRFGKFLRKTSLDELPELFCILIGSMSFVGPRPLLIEYLPYYTREEHRRHDVRPGLTGWAQVNGRNSLRWDERFKKDLEYVDNLNFGMDFKIFLMTIKKVLFKEDIQMGEELHFSRLDIERGPKPVYKRITLEDFQKNSDDLYKCIMELKHNDAAEADRIIANMETYLKDGSAVIECAYVADRIVGFIWGYHIADGRVHIPYFSVLRKYRNNGIGKQLLQKLAEDTEHAGFELLVNKDNAKAIAFYRKNGFVQSDYDEHKYRMLLGC